MPGPDDMLKDGSVTAGLKGLPLATASGMDLCFPDQDENLPWLQKELSVMSCCR